MKEISLTQGKVAIVDDEDYKWLAQWKWYCHGKYAERGFPIRIKMHRVIINTPPGMETDHINGNGLDNRKSNLRICTHSENMMNQCVQKRSATGFKGVWFSKQHKKWRACIRNNKVHIHLGLFSTPEDAARAYDDAAKQVFGEFAKTNFIEAKLEKG